MPLNKLLISFLWNKLHLCLMIRLTLSFTVKRQYRIYLWFCFRNRYHTGRRRLPAFTYLIHLGYLSYNMDSETCRIPNREVRQEWIYSIEEEDEYETTDKIIRDSKELLAHTIAGDAEAVARALDESHIHVTSNRSYNNEDALGSAIYLSYIYAPNSFTCVREMTVGKGFADVVYIPVHPGDPGKPAMIMELKRKGSAQSALDQIKEKNTSTALSIIRAGSFSSK